MGFDPNALPSPKRPEWATYIKGRRGKAFKMHDNRGQALNAVAYLPREAQIFRYDFEKGEWIEVWSGVVKDPRYGQERPEVCERCGQSTMVESRFERKTVNGGYEQGVHRYNYGGMGWLAEPTNKKKLVEPFKRVWLCRSCR